MYTPFRYSISKLCCGLSLFLYFAAPAQAGDFIPITHLRVAQEISRNNGVLVSRPSDRHQKIVDLIARNRIQSLEDYVAWLKNNIHYQNDSKTNTWSTPEQTLQNKTGDCEDYAMLNATVMEVLGYKPQFLALVKKGRRGHAICIFKHDGYFFWFDNDHLQKTTATSLDQFAKKMSAQFGYSTLLELDLETKNWNVLYKKS